MRGRSRRGSGYAEAADDGPFASFTDLFIGILFLFLILVAALMLMHQEAIQREQVETQLMSQRIRDLQAKLDAVPKPKPAPEQPAFRLGIAFNIYQRPAGAGEDWTFSRTVRIFRSPDGHCINTVMVRSNLSTAWRPPVGEADIPTPAQRDLLQKIEPCEISASGDHWNSAAETGNMKRVAPNLYSGTAVLHKKEGDVRLDVQYRVLGVYDDYFR